MGSGNRQTFNSRNTRLGNRHFLRPTADYPHPIVDHAEAVRLARQRFRDIRTSANYKSDSEKVRLLHGSRKPSTRRHRHPTHGKRKLPCYLVPSQVRAYPIHVGEHRNRVHFSPTDPRLSIACHCERICADPHRLDATIECCRCALEGRLSDRISFVLERL